jgi:ABC-type sugar transport system permease subunit
MGRRTRQALLGWSLLVPSAAIFGAFVFYPLYRLIDLGLHQKNRFGTAERYVGLSQYREVLGGEEFRSGLSVTVRFVL